MKSALFENVELIEGETSWYKISDVEMTRIEHIVDKVCAAGRGCPWYQSFVEMKKLYEDLRISYDRSWDIFLSHGELGEREWQRYDVMLERINDKKDK